MIHRFVAEHPEPNDFVIFILVMSQTGLGTRTRSFCRTRARKYLKQVRVNFHLYNIITTKLKKKQIFLLEIKNLMQKVGLSQAFSKIV